MHISYSQIYRRLCHPLSVGGAAAPSAHLCPLPCLTVLLAVEKQDQNMKKSLTDLSSIG